MEEPPSQAPAGIERVERDPHGDAITRSLAASAAAGVREVVVRLDAIDARLDALTRKVDAIARAVDADPPE